MLLYPEVQKAAQDEIDRVVGSDRLPAYNDMSALPYLTAVMMESLRQVVSMDYSYTYL